MKSWHQVSSILKINFQAYTICAHFASIAIFQHIKLIESFNKAIKIGLNSKCIAWKEKKPAKSWLQIQNFWQLENSKCYVPLFSPHTTGNHQLNAYCHITTSTDHHTSGEFYINSLKMYCQSQLSTFAGYQRKW